jgi:hypothetical protein
VAVSHFCSDKAFARCLKFQSIDISKGEIEMNWLFCSFLLRHSIHISKDEIEMNWLFRSFFQWLSLEKMRKVSLDCNWF